MNSLIRWFADGGPFLLLIVGLSVALLAAVLVTLVLAFIERGRDVPRREVRLVAIGAAIACLLPLLVGVLGTAVGLEQMSQALLVASPEHVESIREVGTHLAYRSTHFGALCSVVLLIPALGAVFVAPSVPPSYTVE